MSAIVLPMQAAVLARRGRLAEAAALADEFVPLAREIEDAQVLVPALDVAASIAFARGDSAKAVALLDAVTRPYYALAEGRRTLVAAGAPDRARALLERATDPVPRTEHSRLSAEAILAEAGGELARAADLYDDAAQRWASYGHVLEHAFALVGRGRCARSATDVREARRVFADLGAIPLVAEADALLSEQAAAS